MFPHEVVPLDEEKNAELKRHFEGERSGFCQVGSKKWILPRSYALHAEGYYTMPLRSDDVWIVTFPRTGTTVCQELIWMVNTGFDYETSSKVQLETRFPFYEFGLLHHEEFHKEVLALNNNDPAIAKTLASWREQGYVLGPKMSSPRHLKTHLPFSLLPPDLTKTSKAIYVARNPKDVVVSYYHHNRFLKAHGYNGSFEKYWEYFEKSLLVYTPFWDHVLEGWERRNDPNVLFIFYEDMVKDTPSTIKKVAEFLNKKVSPEQVERLANHLQIDNFRKNVPLAVDSDIKGIVVTSEQGFIRKGKVGKHEEFTPELMARAEKWINKHLQETDLQFPS